MAVVAVTKGPYSSADDATLIGMEPLGYRSTGHDHTIDDHFIDEQRLEKITQLKQAVAQGTYRVSAEQLADKLIEHMLEPKA